MSGASGANLEIGGLGSLKCYRFIVDDNDMVASSNNISGAVSSSGKWKKKRKEIIDAAYASSTTRFTNTVSTAANHGSNCINDNQANIMANKATIINNHKAQLALNIPGYLPWIVIDVENDPTCFIVEISTVGYQPPPLLDENENGGVEEEEGGNSELNGEDRSNSYVEAVIKEEEEEEQQAQQEKSSDDEEEDDGGDYEHDDGVFVFWGDDDDDENDIEEEEEKMGNKRQHSLGLKKPTTKSKAPPSRSQSSDQVQLDLARAISKNKPYIRYTFKCLSSRKNEKALWLAAFSKVGRLSDESRRKKTLFGTTSLSNTVATSSSSYLVPKSVVSQSKKHSRIRKTSSQSKTAVDFGKLSSLGNGGGGLNSNSGENDNEEELSSSVIDQKEYRVRPNYSYQHRWMTNSELKEEMMCPSSVMHDTRLSPTILATTDNRRELGLLRVEVLQCLGVHRVNKGKANPNCVVYLVLGSYAFATDVIPQKKNPMWLRGMRRACALPVFHGCKFIFLLIYLLVGWLSTALTPSLSFYVKTKRCKSNDWCIPR